MIGGSRAAESPDVTRLEAFSDAVFAFALTLLVVALEVPRSFEELMGAMRGFLAFGLCFVLLLTIWKSHYRFFRKYPLADSWTIVLNSGLLFVVLFYVYPLKFLMSVLVHEFFGIESGQVDTASIIRGPQMSSVMMIYGAGYLTISVIFALLHAHARRRQAELGLDAAERMELQMWMQHHMIAAGVAVLSILLAALPLRYGPLFSGLSYMLLGPLMSINGVRMGKAVERLRNATQVPA
jgi:uncharacterized membrane protein